MEEISNEILFIILEYVSIDIDMRFTLRLVDKRFYSICELHKLDLNEDKLLKLLLNKKTESFCYLFSKLTISFESLNKFIKESAYNKTDDILKFILDDKRFNLVSLENYIIHLLTIYKRYDILYYYILNNEIQKDNLIILFNSSILHNQYNILDFLIKKYKHWIDIDTIHFPFFFVTIDDSFHLLQLINENNLLQWNKYKHSFINECIKINSYRVLKWIFENTIIPNTISTWITREACLFENVEILDLILNNVKDFNKEICIRAAKRIKNEEIVSLLCNS